MQLLYQKGHFSMKDIHDTEWMILKNDKWRKQKMGGESEFEIETIEDWKNDKELEERWRNFIWQCMVSI